MTMTPEQAKEIGQMRLKIVQNMKDGVPPNTGIDEERLKAALAEIRQTRDIGAGVNNKKAKPTATIPLDLEAFMKPKGK